MSIVAVVNSLPFYLVLKLTTRHLVLLKANAVCVLLPYVFYETIVNAVF